MGKTTRKLFNIPLAELTPDEVQEITKICWHDPVYFCSYFLSSLFPTKMPWVHRGILSILTGKTDFLWKYGEIDKIVSNFVYERDGVLHSVFERNGNKLTLNKGRFTLIILPRGYSKTTLAGVAFNIYNIVYLELPFAAYVSETARHAEMQMDNVKRQLEGNEKIKFFFGDMKPGMQDAARWRQDFFETTTGMAMAARGRGGQVRGLNHNGDRPKIIIADDLEDRESVRVPERRDDTKKWAYADLMPALPALDPSATILALGTILHPDALIMTWARDPQWTVIKFGAYDRQGDLLWKENMDEGKLEKEKESARLAGTLSEFYMERMSEVRITEDSTFKAENFQYGMAETEFRVLYNDPAISDNKTADRATFTVVGMTKGGKRIVLESFGERGMLVDAQVSKIFELWKKWDVHAVGIEANAYQRALIHITKAEMFKRNSFFEIIPVINTRAKVERIKGILQPLFGNKAVWFAGKFIQLEQELLSFGIPGQKDDHADGLAGACSLLDPAAFLAQDEQSQEKVKPLEEEIGGDWRHAL